MLLIATALHSDCVSNILTLKTVLASSCLLLVAQIFLW